jgi:hypothetical protein
MGIIESKSVWMTEFGYLNDRQEVTYGLNLLLNTIERMQGDETSEDKRGLLLSWANGLKQIPNRVCITSFSAEDDSLSQWRAYGTVAIGFPVHPLALHVDQGRLQKVEYDPTTQQKLIDIYLNHLANAFVVDSKEARLERVPDIYHKTDRLLELVTFFKDPAFQSENEYRLAYIDYPEVLSSFGIESPPKSFKVSNGKIVPYVPSTDILQSKETDFPLNISEIVIGPESDELLEQGIKEFLSAKGVSNVTVRRSLVPLRS